MKLNILILCGGPSGEHPVSLRSALSVLKAIDQTRFNPFLVALDYEGRWVTGDPLVQDPDDPKNIRLAQGLREVRLEQGCVEGKKIDCVFSVIHGTWGEDGSMQGFLEMQNLPYVGSGVLGSAMGMDKEVMKRLFKEAGIQSAPYLAVRNYEPRPSWEQACSKLGQVLFIKPASQGSSLGITRATNKESYLKGLEEAFGCDKKVLIEKGIKGREIELSVLGNHELQVSVAGEIVPEELFYSYEAKYILNTTKLLIPAPVSAKLLERLQAQAKAVFRCMELEGFARIDFFVDENEEIWANEPNTLPGFTSISMYSKMFEASGIPYSQLISKLIELGLERHQARPAFRV